MVKIINIMLRTFFHNFFLKKLLSFYFFFYMSNGLAFMLFPLIFCDFINHYIFMLSLAKFLTRGQFWRKHLCPYSTLSNLTPTTCGLSQGRAPSQQVGCVEATADKTFDMKSGFDMNSRYSYKENNEYTILSKVIENISGFIYHVEEWCNYSNLTFIHVFKREKKSNKV